MDKLKFRRSGIQARVLALTMFFTLGASLVIAASNMHQMTAEWERTTILNAEYALQTAASAIRRDVDEIDDLAGWCAYNPGMRTYLLTGDTASNQALSMYPTLTAKFNSMRTMAYIQRFLLINASGRQMMFGTAATNAVTLTPDILQRIPGYDSPNTGWDCILRDPLALNSQAANTIPVTHTLTLPGTDRTAHVCIFVSPSLILSPLRSFTLADAKVLSLFKPGIPTLLIANKLDTVHRRAEIAPWLRDMQERHPFAEFVPMSAKNKGDIERLFGICEKYLPEQPWWYAEDELTDRSEKFLASETVREKLFRFTGDELPYTSTVVIDKFEEEKSKQYKRFIRIAATIVVERDGHKAMVIGEKGEKLKRISTEARQELEKLMDAKVFLEVWVKVRSGWADDEARVRSFGYE